MLQAEIAGRLIPPSGGHPEVGNVLPDFELSSSQGQPVLASAYRGRSNLVLILAAGASLLSDLVSELENKRQELSENNARILVIAAGTAQRARELKQELRLDEDMLVDLDGRVHRTLGAIDAAGHFVPMVFVTDRFGEIFAIFKIDEHKSIPSAEEVLGWLEFINRQCPECGAREWPD
jgi:peroxiredoxin